MTLSDGTDEVVIPAAGPVAAAGAGDQAGVGGITEEQILARDGFAIAVGKFVKPAGFTVYKFRPSSLLFLAGRG